MVVLTLALVTEQARLRHESLPVVTPLDTGGTVNRAIGRLLGSQVRFVVGECITALDPGSTSMN